MKFRKSILFFAATAMKALPKRFTADHRLYGFCSTVRRKPC